MRMCNPSLNRWMRKAERGQLDFDETASTHKGVYLKAGLFGALTLFSAVAVEALMIWLLITLNLNALLYLGIGSVVAAIALLVISLIIVFAPSTVKVLGVIYSILQGGLLGLLTASVDLFYPGIGFAAFLGTAIVFLVALIVNKVAQVRISSRFMRGLMVAFISLIVVELVMGLLSLFGLFDFAAFWWIQLIASALCIIWATVMLFWDLQNIDYLVQVGAPKKYEWNVAFSLVTTLVYMYLEILELLVRLAAIFGRRN